MTWAAHRKATRIKDVAYSLIGIFDINMTITYGEGDRAFKRFMAELIQNCKDLQTPFESEDAIKVENSTSPPRCGCHYM